MTARNGALGTAIAAALVVLGVAAPVAAETPVDFTFKRVKVGEQPIGQRITVQIDPEEQARVLAANPAVPRAPTPEESEALAAAARPAADGGSPAGAAYGWFWEHLSPARADGHAGRLDAAVSALSKGPGGTRVATPRLNTLQEIADAYGADILQATVGTGVSPAFVLAVIGIESAGKPRAVSPKGAAGLMQLMPATAERFGVTDREDPGQNIRGGVAYLDWLLDRFDRDPVLALAGYNSGEGSVDRFGGVPPFAETRDYVPKVLAAWSVAKGLCMTPPQLVSDGCVFRRGGPTFRSNARAFGNGG